jgi:hypothetical protein
MTISEWREYMRQHTAKQKPLNLNQIRCPTRYNSPEWRKVLLTIWRQTESLTYCCSRYGTNFDYNINGRRHHNTYVTLKNTSGDLRIQNLAEPRLTSIGFLHLLPFFRWLNFLPRSQ